MIELYNTETTYLEKLNIIIKKYQKPLVINAESENPFITMNEVRGIFSSAEVIMGLTKVVHGELEEALKNWSSASLVGPIFLKLTNFFRWYQTYCSNYTKVHDHLLNLKAKQPLFKEFIEKIEKSDVCKGEDIESSLIRVVQRIPQYNMLLNDYLKNTWEDHPDYQNLVTAVSGMQQTGKMVNEYIREYENVQKVASLGLALEGYKGLAIPARRHVFDALFLEIVDENTTEDRHIFLFNDLLLLTSPIPTKKGQIPRYKTLIYSYLIHLVKGNPLIQVNDTEGPEFKIQIKGSELLLKSRKAIDKERFLMMLDSTIKTAKNNFDKNVKEDITPVESTRADDNVDSVQQNIDILLDEGEKNGQHALDSTPALVKSLQRLYKDFTKNDRIWVAPFEKYDDFIQNKMVPHTIAIFKYHILLVCNNKVVLVKHFLELTEISSPIYPQLKISFNTGNSKISGISQKADQIINCLRIHYSRNFPGKPNHLPLLVPNDRLLKIDFGREFPCGGFLETYNSVCSFFEIEPRQDIIFDINILYSKGITEFDFGRFEQPINTDDIQAIMMALIYNPYFKAIKIDGTMTKAPKDFFPFLLNLLRKSVFIESILLSKVEMSRELVIELAKAISLNTNLPLKLIDLSNTVIDDKGIAFLSDCIKGRFLEVLVLQNCQIKKGFALLIDSLPRGGRLVQLNINNNSLDHEAITALVTYLESPNNITKLGLSNVKINKNEEYLISQAIAKGCLWNLLELDISCSNQPIEGQNWKNLKQFVQRSSTLKYLNISKTGITGTQFVELCQLVHENNDLKDVTLIATLNGFTVEAANQISQFIENLGRNILKMDISDNEFGDEGMVPIINALSTPQHSVRELIANRNILFKKGKQGTQIRNNLKIALLNLAQSQNSALRVIHIAASTNKATQLREDIHPFLIGLTKSMIEEVNISGHRMGYSGTLYLAKAVQCNPRLKKIYWDDNATTLAGFRQFLRAIETSCNLIDCPIPLNDVKVTIK